MAWSRPTPGRLQADFEADSSLLQAITPMTRPPLLPRASSEKMDIEDKPKMAPSWPKTAPPAKGKAATGD